MFEIEAKTGEASGSSAVHRGEKAAVSGGAGRIEAFAGRWSVPAEPLRRVAEVYPFRTSAHFERLMQRPGDPIWRQVVPDLRELQNPGGFRDPLGEEERSPVPNLVHRYPDRVLWIVSNRCAVHCRFCTRKRRWTDSVPADASLQAAGLDYIKKHPEIRDVLLSGGDPLMLHPSILEEYLRALRAIRHVAIVRIGTRVPSADPDRITPELARMLALYHPLYVNIHFNHPREINPRSALACSRLADAGIPLGSQTVLLRSVNDSAEVLRELFLDLLRLRVRPYYLFQMDLMESTAHFRTPLHQGLAIVQSLRNHISGLAIPQFVVDLPGGHGKVPLVPNAILRVKQDRVVFRDFTGKNREYPLMPGEEEELKRFLSAD